jgi:hypothetical protein
MHSVCFSGPCCLLSGKTMLVSICKLTWLSCKPLHTNERDALGCQLHILLWTGWCWSGGINLRNVSSFFKISVQFLTFSFVDSVTMLLAQAPKLAVLNSFLLGIISSRITVNIWHNWCSQAQSSIWAWKSNTTLSLSRWTTFICTCLFLSNNNIYFLPSSPMSLPVTITSAMQKTNSYKQLNTGKKKL